MKHVCEFSNQFLITHLPKGITSSVFICNIHIISIVFIITMCVDNILPFIIAMFYKRYSHKCMVLSVLGSKQSSVKWIYNIWCIISGVCFATCSIAMAILNTDGLTIAIAVLLSAYGFACEIISGLFPLNEKREDIDLSSKIHGGFSAIGFMCLLPVPLLISIHYITYLAVSILSIMCFALAILFFCFFIMGDKDKYKNTIISYEGIWQRLILLFCYIPIIFFSVIL